MPPQQRRFSIFHSSVKMFAYLFGRARALDWTGVFINMHVCCIEAYLNVVWILLYCDAYTSSMMDVIWTFWRSAVLILAWIGMMSRDTRALTKEEQTKKQNNIIKLPCMLYAISGDSVAFVVESAILCGYIFILYTINRLMRALCILNVYITLCICYKHTDTHSQHTNSRIWMTFK